MAAVIATTSGRSRPMATISSLNSSVQMRPETSNGRPGLGVETADAVELVGLVVDGRVVAAALLGDDVHDDRAAEGLRARRRAASTACSSWPSTGPRYFRPRSSNIPCGATMSLMPFFMPCSVSYIAPPTTGVRFERVLAPVEEPLVAAGRAQRGEVVGEAADGRGVGALVVVDDDDQGQVLVGGDVVDRLPGHAAGEGAVADDRDGVPVALAAQAARLGDAVGPGQGRRRVGVLDDVVLGLGAAGVAGQAALLLAAC